MEDTKQRETSPPTGQRRKQFFRERRKYLNQPFLKDFEGIDHLVNLPWHEEAPDQAEDVILTSAQVLASQDFKNRRIGIVVPTIARQYSKALDLLQNVRPHCPGFPMAVVTQPEICGERPYEEKAWKVLTGMLLANRLKANFATVDMDVNFICRGDSASSLYRGLLDPFASKNPPALVQPETPRSWANDDAVINLLARLFLSWSYGVQLRHMAGGDFALRRDTVARAVADHKLAFDGLYDLEVDLTLSVLAHGETIATQPMRHKVHAPIGASKVHRRLLEIIPQLFNGLSRHPALSGQVTAYTTTPNGDVPDYGPVGFWAAPHCVARLHSLFRESLSRSFHIYRQILAPDLDGRLFAVAQDRFPFVRCEPELLAAITAAFASAWKSRSVPRSDLTVAFRPIAYLMSLAALCGLGCQGNDAEYAELEYKLGSWAKVSA